jgi:hemerythrin
MLVWKDVHSIGKKELDEQHKFFFDIINILDECKDYNCAKSNLELFEKHLIEHFSTEEQFMSDINFPKFQSHKELHIEMLEEVLFFSNKAEIEKDENKKFLIFKEFIVFIRDHIINHLLGDDIEIKLWYDEKRKFDKKFNY